MNVSELQTHRRFLVLVTSVLLLIEATGCGDGREKVSAVRGKVTYKGQGVPQSTVVLFRVDPPNEATRKLHPYAYVGNDGQFEIKTYVDGDGAPPGKYRVSIIAPSAGVISKKDRSVEAESSSGPAVKVPQAIAAKYANVETAGIEITVVPGENNLEPFELATAGGR